MAEIRALLVEVEQLFSIYDPRSALSHLNREGQLVDPDRKFIDLMEAAAVVHVATDGLFDPTIQPLWAALARGEDPADARRAVGFDRVVIRPDRIALAPGQALTFNGIAQGFATDLARAALHARGFTRALVNIGEFAALGGPFRLGLADPARGLVATRTFTDRCIATSGPAAMMLRRTSHILNPRGTTPPRWSTVSVTADSATIADAASTAFCLMPRRQIRTALRRLPGRPHATLIARDGALTTLGGA
ncbi:FAD:protein FMN transferase [Jhaorihella thermophila]|uniref:FAD:protein FMN transferase n=1 Tax=Jhaorihella thermophila TaxID=488547 RepID=UPI000CDF2174|nr:FAD:protein FMN transferase [Jhaorihella thermophila]